jgi:hypothetical protein
MLITNAAAVLTGAAGAAARSDARDLRIAADGSSPKWAAACCPWPAKRCWTPPTV